MCIARPSVSVFNVNYYIKILPLSPEENVLCSRFRSLCVFSVRGHALHSSSTMFAHLHRLSCSYTCGGKQAVFFHSRLFHVEKNFEAMWEEINIPVPWGNLSGKWWGSTDTQPILSVHGWEDNAGSFDGLAPLLNTSVLAIDLPGHGFSSHCLLGTTYNFMDGVTLIRHIVRHFKWEDVTIIGHSYGSALAFAYSAFFPKNVKNLIGIECARAEITQKSDSVAKELRNALDSALHLEETISSKPAYSLNDMVDILHMHRRRLISKNSCELLLKRGAKKADEEGKYAFLRDPRINELPLGRMTDDLLFACSSRITCNVLNILANPGEIMANYAYAETAKLMKMSAMLFEDHTVEGPHHVHLENPEIVAPIIKKFLSIS